VGAIALAHPCVNMHACFPAVPSVHHTPCDILMLKKEIGRNIQFIYTG
jgi:hypothetical protein